MPHHTQKERRENIQALRQLILEKCSQENAGQMQVVRVSLDILVALAAYRLGFTEHSTMEYLGVLTRLRMIRYDEEARTVSPRED